MCGKPSGSQAAEALRRAGAWTALKRRWPVFASVGVNAGMIALIALIPQRSLTPVEPDIIDVTLVELDEADPAEDEPEPEPEPEPAAPAESETAPAPEREAMIEVPTPETPPTGLQSPITAAPDETADAAPLTGRRGDIPQLDLPVFDAPEAQQQARAESALRGLACNRLGRERPDWCDEEESDGLDAPEPPEFAEQPDMAPKEWAAFELPRREAWCGQSDGVIRDVFVEDSNPYRQGAAAGIGTLSHDSLTGDCPN